MTDSASPDVYLLGAGFGRAMSRKIPLFKILHCVLERHRGAVHLPAEVVAMMREHALRRRAVADKYAFSRFPGLRQNRAPHPRALKRARRVICLGYSLPESDRTMMHFLRTTCGIVRTR